MRSLGISIKKKWLIQSFFQVIIFAIVVVASAQRADIGLTLLENALADRLALPPLFTPALRYPSAAIGLNGDILGAPARSVDNNDGILRRLFNRIRNPVEILRNWRLGNNADRLYENYGRQWTDSVALNGQFAPIAPIAPASFAWTGQGLRL